MYIQNNQPNQNTSWFLKLTGKQVRLSISLFMVLLLFFAGHEYQYAASGKGTVETEKLSSYIENARKAWKIPGMAVAVVKDGKVVLARGFGVKEYGKSAKVDDKTLFAIASNTKAFTATTLAILVDEGKLEWDDKVRKYLPYFELYDPYVSNEMMVEDLLCHRSGLGTFSGDLLWYETPYSTVDILKRIKHLKPAFSFRNGYGYSNLMYMAAGEVVPGVTGRSWKEFVKERVFNPLGMATTSVGSKGLKNYDNVATPHSVYADGRTSIVAYTSSDSTAGAASMNSNVSDMARWITLLLNKGKHGDKQIVSEESLEKMWTPHNSFIVGSGYRSVFPTTHFRGYGLGFSLFDYKGRKVASHGGALDGMISRVTVVPAANFGFVILTNSINGLPSALNYKILDTFLGGETRDWSAYYLERFENGHKRDMERRAEMDKKRAGIAAKTASAKKLNLDDFTGRYSGPMYGDATITMEKGKLVLNLIPAPIFVSDLTHLFYDTFKLKTRGTFSFMPGGLGTVQFLRDKDGNVYEMIVDIPNRDFFFTELEFKKKK